MIYQKEREFFCIACQAIAAPNTRAQYVHRLARRLMNLAQQLDTLAVKQCNDPNFGEREYNKRAKLKGEVRGAVCELTGQSFELEFSNDPRGCPVIIKNELIRNDFNGTGLCVPTRVR